MFLNNFGWPTKVDVFVGARLALVFLSLLVLARFIRFARLAVAEWVAHRKPRDSYSLGAGICLTALGVGVGSFVSAWLLFGREGPRTPVWAFALYILQVGFQMGGYLLHLYSYKMADSDNHAGLRRSAIRSMWETAFIMLCLTLGAALLNSWVRMHGAG